MPTVSKYCPLSKEKVSYLGLSSLHPITELREMPRHRSVGNISAFIGAMHEVMTSLQSKPQLIQICNERIATFTIFKKHLCLCVYGAQS